MVELRRNHNVRLHSRLPNTVVFTWRLERQHFVQQRRNWHISKRDRAMGTSRKSCIMGFAALIFVESLKNPHSNPYYTMALAERATTRAGDKVKEKTKKKCRVRSFPYSRGAKPWTACYYCSPQGKTSDTTYLQLNNGSGDRRISRIDTFKHI